jgi:hypothetical protein
MPSTAPRSSAAAVLVGTVLNAELERQDMPKAEPTTLLS